MRIGKPALSLGKWNQHRQGREQGQGGQEAETCKLEGPISNPFLQIRAQAAAMSGVTASKDDAEVRPLCKHCSTASSPSIAQATAEEMEPEIQHKTWSMDELPQPLSSDVEPQDCQAMSRRLDYPPIADQVVTLLVLLYFAMFGCYP